MPRTHTIPIGTNVTPAQLEIIRALAVQDGGLSQYLHRLIVEDAERRGVDYPPPLLRGKYNRQPAK